jgi:hypothetical protein
MKNVGRGAAFFCLCFLACLLMDSFFPAREAEHDCDGENCPVCARIAAARSSAGNAAPPSGTVFFRPFTEPNARHGASEGRDDWRRLSPAELRVKLTR